MNVAVASDGSYNKVHGVDELQKVGPQSQYCESFYEYFSAQAIPNHFLRPTLAMSMRPPNDKSLDDEFDRQTFYRGQDPEADEEDDYEILPPDEEVIAGEKRRAEEAVAHASKAVDLDHLYRDHTDTAINDIQDYLKDVRFQFGVKHLLMAMTALAVVFVLGRMMFGGLGTVLLILTFLTLAGAYGWITWQESIRYREWEAKRDELYRRHQERDVES